MAGFGLDLYSVSDLRRPGALREIGRAFDADPQLHPDRIDVRDPIRRKVTSAEDYFAELEQVSGKRRTWHLFERRTTPRIGGAIDWKDVDPGLIEYPHRLYLGTLGEEDDQWIMAPDHADAFAALFVRLAGAFDAYMGFAGEHRLPRQQMAEFARARLAGKAAPPIPGPFTDKTSLRDVYWLNFFGPSYVERWGSGLEGLGIRQERTSNGGLVVWAAEQPILYRDDLASVMDYPWKQPFYAALGRDTFVHVGQPAGQYVPTRADHVRFARRLDEAGGAEERESSRGPVDLPREEQ